MIPPANPPPEASPPLAAPASAGAVLVKRLARLRKRIFTSLRGGEPTPQAFHRTSADLRRAGDLAAAEAACSRAIGIHPANLGLAIEHAKIAKAAKNLPLRISRWQRVLDLGGDQAPASAFEELAICHRDDPAAAEALLRQGLALHPADFSLLRKLGDLAAARGLTPAAIEAWQAAIKAHPEKDLAPIYVQLGHALREEGLLARAETMLREGTVKYPDDPPLRDAHANLAYLLAIPTRVPVPCDSGHPAICHLFQDRYLPSARGILAFSPGSGALRQQVPAMLDFAEIVPAPREAGAVGTADAFAIWGAPTDSHHPIRETAAAAGKPLLCLESGFLSSPGIEGRDAPAHSVVVTQDAVYYDATRPSELVDLLNSDTFILTAGQRTRAENCVAAIVANRLSKFNHAPRIDLRPRFPADGTRRILLIDQRRRGGSVHWSLGGQASFERMMETALAMPDCQILVKIHPEAIRDRAPSFLAPLIPSPLPANFAVIDFDVNPHDLLEVVAEVFVGTSQMGFEAVLAGKQVHCFAAPYYAGWGFTRDHTVIPRRRRGRTPAEVFHLYHIVRARYFVPERGVAEIEDLITYLTAVGNNALPSAPARESPAGPLKVLIVLPSGRDGATGRYIRHLSAALVDLGCEMMVLAEGNCPRLDAGVRWIKLEFEGSRLASALRREILGFAPDFVYVNGYRSRSQRAALEAVLLTGARLAMQWEDDDTQVHRHRRSAQAAEQLCALDRPRLTTAEIAGFLKNYDWNHGLQVLLDPEFDRWVEPLPRMLCSRLACVHTAIWQPYAERLAREFAVPTLVVPPVASAADFERLPMTPQERAATLRRYDIDPAATVIFIGGALYSYSDEFAVFLTALDLAAREPAANFALVVTSGRSSLPLALMAAERLGPSVSFTDIGDSPDAVYLEMLKACDIACSPGLPDDFNRYRLPSRLVKSMAMAKPILTCRCGFGESLEHGHNAFLMDGEDPAEWAAVITLTRDAAIRADVGNRGQHFAREHFDAPRVAAALKRQFEHQLAAPPRNLAAGIATLETRTAGPRAAPAIRLGNRGPTPLRAAIRALAARTNHLDAVLHLGIRNPLDLDDYCRLGARRIHLVANSPELAAHVREFMGMEGSITVDEVAHFSEIQRSVEPSDYGLLVIEGNPPEMNTRFISRFRWVIVHAGNPGEFVAALAGAGFREIALPVDHGYLTPTLLFELEATAGTHASS
jgi:glycosyltransferase involved in cell wall biosynthesis